MSKENGVEEVEVLAGAVIEDRKETSVEQQLREELERVKSENAKLKGINVFSDENLSKENAQLKDQIKSLQIQNDYLSDMYVLGKTIMAEDAEESFKLNDQISKLENKLSAEHEQGEINEELRREEKAKAKQQVAAAQKEAAEAKSEANTYKELNQEQHMQFGDLHAKYMEYVNKEKAEKQSKLGIILDRAKQYMHDKTVGKVKDVVVEHESQKNMDALKQVLQYKKENPEFKMDLSKSPTERLKEVNTKIHEKQQEEKKEAKRLKEAEKARQKTAKKIAFNQTVVLPVQFTLETYKAIRQEKKAEKLENKELKKAQKLENKQIKKSEREAKREQFRNDTKKFMDTTKLKTASLGAKIGNGLKSVVSRAATNVGENTKEFSDKFGKLVSATFVEPFKKYKDARDKAYDSLDPNKTKDVNKDNERAM